MSASVAEIVAIIDHHMTSLLSALHAAAERDDERGGPSVALVEDGPTRGEEGWVVGETRTDATYRWMDGNVDHYSTLTEFTNSKTKERMAIGTTTPTEYRGVVRSWHVVFPLDNRLLGDPLAVFTDADDHVTTAEAVALIRGKGDKKRAGYAPSEPLPAAYDRFKVETYKDRLSWKRSWNRRAVVAKKDDHDTMLNFAALQRAIRFG